MTHKPGWTGLVVLVVLVVLILVVLLVLDGLTDPDTKLTSLQP